jgi:hypothetical protein
MGALPVVLLVLAGAVDARATVREAGPPLVVGRSALSAQPVDLSVGPAGPFNRWAFDVEHFDPADGSARVTCLYGADFAYRCDAAIADQAGPAGRRRVNVTIPDLGRGTEVTVRFATARGRHDVVLELANVPQVVHEIEALTLAGGGRVVTGSDGRPRPAGQIVRARATSTPAMAASSLGAPPGCDRLYAQWVGATATDAVFTGPLGTLDGALTVSRPVAAGARVAPDNLPEWLVTYPLGANRVQFIAHYEVIFRVGTCEMRRLNEPLARGASAPRRSRPPPSPAAA